MSAAEILGLAGELEVLAVKEWLRERGVPEDISAIDFAIWCLQDEGIPADAKLAETILWDCTGFPAFWQIGRHGDHPIACCETQLRGWAKVAIRSKEHASRLLDDPTYSFEQALADIATQAGELRQRLLEDD